MNFWKAPLNATEHLLVPINLQVGMQSALHQHAGAAQFDGFTNLVVNGVEIENVSFFSAWPFEWPIESAEGAILSAEIGVINIAVDNVRDHTFGMKLAARRIGFHADADEVIRLEHVERLLFSESHDFKEPIIANPSSFYRSGCFRSKLALTQFRGGERPFVWCPRSCSHAGIAGTETSRTGQQRPKTR